MQTLLAVFAVLVLAGLALGALSLYVALRLGKQLAGIHETLKQLLIVEQTEQMLRHTVRSQLTALRGVSGRDLLRERLASRLANQKEAAG